MLCFSTKLVYLFYNTELENFHNKSVFIFRRLYRIRMKKWILRTFAKLTPLSKQMAFCSLRRFVYVNFPECIASHFLLFVYRLKAPLSTRDVTTISSTCSFNSSANLVLFVAVLSMAPCSHCARPNSSYNRVVANPKASAPLASTHFLVPTRRRLTFQATHVEAVDSICALQ